MFGHRRLASETPFKLTFRWRADDGPLLVLFGSSLISSKRCQSWTPSGKTFWISPCPAESFVRGGGGKGVQFQSFDNISLVTNLFNRGEMGSVPEVLRTPIPSKQNGPPAALLRDYIKMAIWWGPMMAQH